MNNGGSIVPAFISRFGELFRTIRQGGVGFLSMKIA
jgi:hypothetical protein